MFEFLAHALAFFYDLWPGSGSYAGAIALFTLAVMLVLSPLSIKTARSMIAMQRVGPELKKLQQKYKHDRETLNKEMMAFYQENNINPFASCLPLLLQMPVFFVLYQVLSGLTRRCDEAAAAANQCEVVGNFNPKYLETDDSALATALRGTDEMVSMGMDLSRGALDVLQNAGLVAAVPFVLLVAAVVVTAFVQQRQIQGRNPDAAANPQQQMIGKIMPFIFIPISVSIPAGVVIYFVVSNAVRIGQQALVTRLEFSEKALAKKPIKSAAGDGKAIDAGSTEKSSSPSKPVKGSTKGSNGKQAQASGGGSRNGSRTTSTTKTGSTARTGGGAQSRNRKKKKRK